MCSEQVSSVRSCLLMVCITDSQNVFSQIEISKLYVLYSGRLRFRYGHKVQPSGKQTFHDIPQSVQAHVTEIHKPDHRAIYHTLCIST